MPILLKSDVPQLHRLVLVIAASLTIKAALDLTRHIGFPSAEFLSTVPFWCIALYNWNQRRNWRARGLTAEEIRAQQDIFGSALDSLNDWLIGRP